MEFQVHRGRGPQEFYWIIVDGSDTLAKSEMLSNFDDARDVANAVKDRTWAYSFGQFWSHVDGCWRWRVTGRNNEKVVSSTGKFKFEATAKVESDRVKVAAPYAVVRDMTGAATRR